ncbi:MULTISPECIES: hypothetical protein [Pseudomonas]|uniref:hypothetical protein n=1 Tax=Pseudomonas TaxID=286 RepID=UPI0010BF8AB8|nr:MULTISPECIES: hypothetical protein [Pseudomonas]
MSSDDKWVEIPLTGRGLERLEREFAGVQETALREAKHKVKQARLETELLAAEYAKVMMQKSINEALDDKTDPRLRRDLRNDIMNRGIGRVPEAENPNRAKQPEELAPGNILEVLAAISASAGAAAIEASRKPPVLGHTRDEPIERDITPEPVAVVERQAAPVSDEDMDFEELMADITREKP